MSEKKAKETRKEELREETANTPIGQIVINVFPDGSVQVHNFPPDLRTCMHVLAEAMIYCTAAFAEHGQKPAPLPPKERNRIVTMGGRR